ncbi:MAG: Cas10/Cmr2 second palm domain-containing protein, partial [Paludibacteraceae bacterium]
MQTNSQPLLFVGGDLSGIQKFLYNITSQKAAVSLKGRSAYLVNFTQKLCTNILSIPLIAAGNRHEIIYCSGGKFYLITDDSPEIRQSIDAFYHQAEQQLWTEHCGQLDIAIAYIPFCFTDDTESEVNIDGAVGKIGELWRTVNEKFTTLKNQKFYAILKTQYDTMFEVQPVGGNTKVCAITGIESAQCVPLEKDGNGEAIWVLPSVKEQIELGEKLRNEEHFKTFEEYATGSYLGVLRMDVDGMGERILREFANLKEYRNFSEKLKSFFEGKDSILHQLQQTPAFKDNLNIIYAGGDDLFIVGRWSAVLDYADE